MVWWGCDSVPRLTVLSVGGLGDMGQMLAGGMVSIRCTLLTWPL